MPGLVNDFSTSPNNNVFGVVTGTAIVLPFPSANTLLVRFKASPFNTIPVYIGSRGVVNYPLDIGDDTGWIGANNLDNFSYMGTGTSYIHYWYQV